MHGDLQVRAALEDGKLGHLLVHDVVLHEKHRHPLELPGTLRHIRRFRLDQRVLRSLDLRVLQSFLHRAILRVVCVVEEINLPRSALMRELGDSLQQIGGLNRLEHRLDVPHVRNVLVQFHELVRQSEDDDPRPRGRLDEIEARVEVDDVRQHHRDAQQRSLPYLIFELILARHGDVVDAGFGPEALHDAGDVLTRALVHRRVEHHPGLGRQGFELRGILDEIRVVAAVDARLPGSLKVQGEEKLGPRALHGLEVDVPSHALDDGLGDDQPEAGSLLLRRLVIRGLAKRDKEGVLLLELDAHAVILHGERDGEAVGFGARGDAHGELHQRGPAVHVRTVLDGVVHQVDAALPETEKVTHELGVEVLGRRDGEDEVHAPARRLLRDVHHLLNELSEGEHVIGELYGGVASAGFVLGALKLGEIKNLVDETQQRFSAGERGFDERLGELGKLAGFHREGVEADDGIERGSKLVRDVEEERSLHARHLNRKRLAPLLQHLDEPQGPGGDDQGVRKLGDDVVVQVPVVLGLAVDVSKLRGEVGDGVPAPRDNLQRDDGHEPRAVHVGQLAEGHHVEQGVDAVIDDEDEARDRRGEKDGALDARRQGEHQAAEQHALVRGDEHGSVHRLVRRGLSLALVARARRGERVRVDVLDDRQQDRRREAPLELPQPGEGHRVAPHEPRSHVGDVPILTEPHLVVGPGRDRADVRHLQVKRRLRDVQRPNRRVYVEHERGSEQHQRRERVVALDPFAGRAVGQADAVGQAILGGEDPA